MGTTMRHATVSPEEVARFDALASRWWDATGPMRPLHAMNPARIGWIEANLQRRGLLATHPRVLDIGCGAGLASEALARLGCDVLGLDAAAEAIAAARAHAAEQDVPVAYRVGTAEELVAEGVRFPVVTALEVIEHVPDPQHFVRLLAQLLEPNGMLFLSTLNRTRRSYAVAKFGAEYVLRLLPVGTHDWRKFITPAELGTMTRSAGLRVADAVGLTANPLTGQWRTGRDLSINYMMLAET